MSSAVIASSAARLRTGSLSFIETLGQSVANIAPTLTPALNISMVVALAGAGAWISYLVATIGLVFVAANIGVLARRHPQAGSYFIYLGRVLGPGTGMIAGWSMLCAYLFTAIAVVISAYIFLTNMLLVLGLRASVPACGVFETGFIGIVWACAYRDIRLSSRIGLVLEGLSLAVILTITAMVVAKQPSVIDPSQLEIHRLRLGSVSSALTFAVFSFVGFESCATLAKEARNPLRAIPWALTLSAVLAGLFFVLISYSMMLGMGDRVTLLGGSSSPFTELTRVAGLKWAAVVVYMSAVISGFACALASINALARMLFSMGRYGFAHRRLGLVHQRYRTPHFAVTAACLCTMAGGLAFSRTVPMAAFGYTATFGTFGFLLVYLLACIAAPIELHRAEALSGRHIIVAATGFLLMAFVILSSMLPVESNPERLLPYFFIAYLLLGAFWYRIASIRASHNPEAIQLDLEA